RRGVVGMVEEDGGPSAPGRRRLCRCFLAGGGRAAEWAPCNSALEVWTRIGEAISQRARRTRPTLGQGWKYLHVGRPFGWHRSSARVGGRRLRCASRARSGARDGAVSATPRRSAPGERIACLTGFRDDVDP